MSFVGDWTGMISGFAFGHGTQYALTGVTGWLDMAQAPMGGAGQLAPRQTRNGSFNVPYFMPSRVVTMMFKFKSATEAAFAEDLLSMLDFTQPGIAETTLSLQVEGVATTVKGRVTNRIIPTTLDWLAGYRTAQIEFTCPDPRRLGGYLMGSTVLPASSGGLTWPAEWGVEWDSTQTTGRTVLVNDGANAPGPVFIRLDGPLTGPIITHVESGLTLAFSSSFVVESGDFVAIDCEARTVLYNGQVSRNGYVTERGWPSLLPGVNTFSFNAASYSAGSMTVTAYPSYI